MKQKIQNHQWIVLVTVMLASFMGRLDGTIVNLALPKIISDFGITVSQAGWIATAYIIANAVFVPIFGKLGDLIGRKSLYLFGIIGFTITSALAGLSFSLPSMIVFRVLQAVTVSIDYPLALSIIAYTFRDNKQRLQAMGMWSAIFAASAVFGPLIGGPLIDNFSWRSIFYINIPVGIIATLLAIRYIVEPVEKIKGIKNFDVAGSLLLGIGLSAMVLVLDQGQAWGWTSIQSVISYFVTFITLVVFVLVERKQKEPVVDLKFFKIPAFTAALITSFISFMGMIGALFILPIFTQTYLGYSVTESGYLFIPMALGMVIAAQVGARLSTIFQPRFVTAAGMFWATIVMYSFSGIDIKWSFMQLSIHLFFLAIGLGLGLSPLTNAAISTVPREEVGVASSLLALARNIAGAFGIAIFATILSNSITSNLLSIEKFSTIRTASPNLLQMAAGLMAVKSNILAFAAVFKSSVYFMFIGSISALFVKEDKSRTAMLAKEHQAIEI